MRLGTILGDIITKVYPVRTQHKVSRRAIYAELETRLDQWYISLPEALQFDVNSKLRVPPPHVLFVHIRYWGAVLLLNRALWVLLILEIPFRFANISEQYS